MWNGHNCLLAFTLLLLACTMLACIIMLPTLEGVTAITAVFIPIIVRVLDKGLQKEKDKELNNGRKPNK